MKKFCFLLLTVSCILFLASCKQIDVFEKNASVPAMQWQNSFQPTFEFTITDTTAQYNLYIVLRHTDAYGYNNIWLHVGSQAPGGDMRYDRVELKLGNDAKGWEGTGMDDIWEVRKPLTNGPISFKKSGNYKFSVAQIMRENPLKNILSVGVRVQKVK